MEGFAQWLDMGGYARYVWSAYLVALVVLVANFVAPLLRARELRRRLARQIRLEREAP